MKNTYLSEYAITERNRKRYTLYLFYKDVFDTNNGDMIAKMKKRRDALIRAEYITEDNAITDKGYAKLIAHENKKILETLNR